MRQPIIIPKNYPFLLTIHFLSRTITFSISISNVPILNNPLFRVTDQKWLSWTFVLSTKREHVRVLVINELVNIDFANERYRHLALKLNSRNQQFQKHVKKNKN